MNGEEKRGPTSKSNNSMVLHCPSSASSLTVERSVQRKTLNPERRPPSVLCLLSSLQKLSDARTPCSLPSPFAIPLSPCSINAVSRFLLLGRNERAHFQSRSWMGRSLNGIDVWIKAFASAEMGSVRKCRSGS